MNKKRQSQLTRHSPSPQSAQVTRILTQIRNGNHQEVRSSALAMLQTSPNHPFALKALAFAQIGLGLFDEAIGTCERALKITQNDAELYGNAAVAHAHQGRFPEAERYFLLAIERAPENYDYYKSLGTTYQAMRRYPEAISAAAKAIELHPGDYTEAIELLARVLMESKQYEHALPCLRELCESLPANTSYRLKLIRCSLRLSDWATLSDDITAYKASLASNSADIDAPFGALTIPSLTRHDHRIGSESIAKSMLREIRNGSPQVALSLDQREQKQRLRVGYISPDFRDHPVGNVITEVLEHHDKSELELFGYAITSDAGSVRHRIEQAFEHFSDLSRTSALDAVSRIRADDLDLLVDLGGWTTDSVPEILMRRCARVQANWLGFPGTMGCREAADYIIGDSVVTPIEHADGYAETIAQKQGCYLPFDTTMPVGPAPSRASLGFPEDVVIFGSHNNNGKFNPAVFDVWCRLLTEVDNSVLWLSAAGSPAEQNLQAEAERRGVAPGRIVFASRVSHTDHLARLQLVDIALDPFPYNSHSAGLATLWAGVPLVCLLGETFAGRVGASMLKTIGRADLIASSIDEYVDIAKRLAGDAALRAKIRSEITSSKRSSGLFNMHQFARDLEHLYRSMIQARETGEMRPIIAG